MHQTPQGCHDDTPEEFQQPERPPGDIWSSSGGKDLLVRLLRKSLLLIDFYPELGASPLICTLCASWVCCDCENCRDWTKKPRHLEPRCDHCAKDNKPGNEWVWVFDVCENNWTELPFGAISEVTTMTPHDFFEIVTCDCDEESE